MTRYATATERRVHAIYAQLGVTFIQCPDLGKDTADKKIISDMWKFYADKSQSKSRIRIVLITGDRDFADTIGQLRNVGVEIGILTGSRVATAPVYDDYTIGMRVLPLLGVISARADEGYANVHQGPDGKYVSKMRDKQEQDYQALLQETEAEGEETRVWATTTPMPPIKESQAVNGSKPSTEVKASTTAVEPTKNGKTSETLPTKIETESKQSDTPTLKSSDVKPIEPPISEVKPTETKSTETKSPETNSTDIKPSALASDEHRSNRSSSPRPDGQVPGTNSWYNTKNTAEERRAYGRERAARRRGAVEAKEQEPRSQTVLGRLGSAFSSWLRPKPVVESKNDSSMISEAKSEEQAKSYASDNLEAQSEEQSADKASISPASRPMPLPTVYREDEKFPLDESGDRLATKFTSTVSTATESPSTSPQTTTMLEAATAVNKPATSEAVTSAPPVEEKKFDLQPLTPQQLNIQLRTTPQTSPIYFAVSPPTSTRPLTSHQPSLKTSIYSSSSLLLPGTPSLFPQPPTPTSYLVRAAITSLSSSPSLPHSPEALVKYYEDEIAKNRPSGVSMDQMRELFIAWVGIERRSPEGLSEESVRRAMRMSLVKAEEIGEARKEERVKRWEEEVAMRDAVRERERNIVLWMLGGKKDYRLTEPTATTQSPPSSTTTQTTETTELKTKVEPTSNSKSTQPTPAAQTTESKKTTTSTKTTASPKTTASTQILESKQTSESDPSESTANKSYSDSSEALQSKPTVESTQPSESIPSTEPPRGISLAENLTAKSTPLEATRVGSSREKWISKNAKRKASGVAVKAQAILEKRKNSAGKVDDKTTETKTTVGKSEVAKPEERSEVGKSEDKRMDANTATVKSDAFKPEDIKEHKTISGKRESSKDETTAGARPINENTEESTLEEKKTATQTMTERRERHSMRTNTIGKHTIASHAAPSRSTTTTDVKTESTTNTVGERKPDTPSTNPAPPNTKKHTKHRRDSSLLERVLGITSTPSSESPVKRFIDIATETFEKNLKRLGVSSEDVQGQKTTVYGQDEKDHGSESRGELATNATTSNAASTSDSPPESTVNLPSSPSEKASAVDGSEGRGKELEQAPEQVIEDNDKSEKAKSFGEKESQSSERPKMW